MDTIKLSPKEKCTGCFACKNICPKDAISVSVDSLGKSVPKLDEKKCIMCKKCVRACPVINDVELKKPEKAYAVWTKDYDDLILSSSGGVATTLSRIVLKNDGVVCGAAIMDGKVQHICITDEKDICLLQGSKYVQSDIGDIYNEIKQFLLDDRQVLFVGTPCQVSGLKLFLNKEYASLITIDLICHGTPPQTYLLQYLDKKIGDYDYFSFRGKYDYKMTVFKNGKINYQNDDNMDLYYRAFEEGLICRDNCYECQYAQIYRVGDLTIGDFWGINRSTMKIKYSGKISLLLINTTKGNNFFEANKKYFFAEERTIAEAVNKEQTNLIHPSKPHRDREKFCRIYKKRGFIVAVFFTDVFLKIFKIKVSNTISKFKKIFYINMDK